MAQALSTLRLIIRPGITPDDALARWNAMLSGHTIRGMFIEGLIARVMYRSLRLLHERVLHGTLSAALGTLSRALSRRTGPPVKLH